MATLTNRNINDTYFGLLKTNDNEVIDGLTRITDGLGCDTSISLNCGNEGACIHGNLTFDTICNFNFPQGTGTTNDIFIHNNCDVTLGNVSSVLDVCTDNLCFNGNVLDLTQDALDRKNIFNPTGTVFITAETSSDRYFRNSNGKTCICFSGLNNSNFQKNSSDQYQIRINLYRRFGRGDFHLRGTQLITTTSDNIAKTAIETNGNYRDASGYLGNSHIEILDNVSGRIINVPNFSVSSSYNFNF